MLPISLQAQQEVEGFLEQAAEEAVGSNYGPAGGKFASKDIRVGVISSDSTRFHFIPELQYSTRVAEVIVVATRKVTLVVLVTLEGLGLVGLETPLVVASLNQLKKNGELMS